MNTEFYNTLFNNKQDLNWNDAPGKLVLLEYIAKKLRNDACSVLDIGCGNGYLTAKIGELFPQWKVSGFDYADVAIERALKDHPEIEFFVDDVHKTGWTEKGPYDLIISYGCFEHFQHPQIAINNLSAALKKEAVFLLMIPTLGAYRTDRNDEGWYEDFNTPPQLQWNYFRETWEAWFKEAGLELFPVDDAREFGALQPANFYFGKKI